MSSEIEMDHIDYKRIKLKDKNEKIKSFGATCSNSVVDSFKNKSMEFYTKQLDDKNVRVFNTFTNTGKMI